MKEFVYHLNLPPLTDILLESAKDKLFNEKSDLIYRHLTTDCVKTEWLSFNNYNWNYILYFYKNNSSGFIHFDGKEILQPDEKAVWGINWIYGNSGIMEYWRMEDIFPPMINHGDPNNRTICKSIRPPFRTYHMSEGVYLVNASFPHNATGNAGRYAFSLRDNTCRETWDTVVDKFKNYII
jgi:hypothetical protein